MSVRACVRVCVGRVEGRGHEYRGPPWRATSSEVPRMTKKKKPPATDRRARRKRREKIISAGAKARERKKNHLGGSEKKFWRQREHNPQKGLRTVETSSFYLFLSGVSTGRSCNISFFVESECKRQKYFVKVNAKRQKIHDDWQVTVQ